MKQLAAISISRLTLRKLTLPERRTPRKTNSCRGSRYFDAYDTASETGGGGVNGWQGRKSQENSRKSVGGRPSRSDS